ncbi:TetR/AcrR family transcriptional regulator [Pararhizobium sp. PWRC1-1]|uniref:TetR/AcrR family transcriptional regulator n=1 Tax=Pararhizobium sp. PWRC1-1 TaxID=2804566 RepID=UPI003CF0E133
MQTADFTAPSVYSIVIVKEYVERQFSRRHAWGAVVARGRARGFDRDEALETAMRLFWLKGYTGTSVAELCAAMGIASPSMYAAFGNKEALYEEALAHFSRTRGMPIWLNVMEAATARDMVEALFLCTIDGYTKTNQPQGCMSTLAMVDHNDSPKLAALVKQGRESTYQMLREKFASAVQCGELPKHAEVDSLARGYLTILQGISIQARDGASRASLISMVKTMMVGWDSITQQIETREEVGDQRCN